MAQTESLTTTIMLEPGDAALVIRADGSGEAVYPRPSKDEEMGAHGFVVSCLSRLLSEEGFIWTLTKLAEERGMLET